MLSIRVYLSSSEKLYSNEKQYVLVMSNSAYNGPFGCFFTPSTPCQRQKCITMPLNAKYRTPWLSDLNKLIKSYVYATRVLPFQNHRP